MTDAKETCALSIDRLADDARFKSRREDLKSLAGALRDQADGSWTGVDLVGAFPADATITGQPTTAWERRFGLIAGAAVFLPVAWTWFGLHKAIDAYDRYLSKTERNPDSRVGDTFLSLWTTGFDGELEQGLHYFGPVALVSVGLIVFALVSIVLHRLLADRNVNREDNYMHGAYKELVIELLRAQRLLNERRTDDPRFLEEAIKRSVGELLKAQEATRQGVEELSAAATNVLSELNSVTASSVAEIGATSSRALGELNGATNKTVSDLSDVVVSLRAQLEPLVQNTSRAGEALVAATETTIQSNERNQAASTQLESSVRVVAEELGKTLSRTQEGFEASSAQMQAEIAKILQQFGLTLGQANSSLSQDTGAALQTLSQSVEKVASAKDEWSRALLTGLAGNERSVEEVAARVQEFVRLLQEHQSSLQAQVSEVSRVADTSSQLLAELQHRNETRTAGR